MIFDELFENHTPVQKKTLKEFAPGGGDEGPGDDPYKYPKPEHYRRSIDFFGQFEADHFDREDMNDATGEFKGYWDYDDKPRLIAYFKFDNPQKTDANDPGMGWYYEPNEDMEEGVQESVNVKQIKKDLDSGMSVDAVIGKHANRRTTNTDEIRRVIQQHAWEKRKNKTKEQGVAETTGVTDYNPRSQGGTRRELIAKYYKTKDPKDAEAARRAGATQKELQDISEGLPAHVKKSDIPPAMRSKMTMKDVETERPRGAYRYRVIPAAKGESPKDFLDWEAARSWARATGGRISPLGEVKKNLGEGEPARSARIERILKMLRARYPQAGDDLEALLLSYRADQAHDQHEIDRLDAENDQEEADIDTLEKVVTDILQRRGITNENLWIAAEKVALSKFHSVSHPAFQVFTESWYRAHGGEIQG